jgi:hypothetical protein
VIWLINLICDHGGKESVPWPVNSDELKITAIKEINQIAVQRGCKENFP